MDIFTKAGAVDAAERTLRTFVAVLMAQLISVQTGILNVPWLDAMSAAGLAALLTLLAYVAYGPKATPPGTVPLAVYAAAVTAPPVNLNAALPQAVAMVSPDTGTVASP